MEAVARGIHRRVDFSVDQHLRSRFEKRVLARGHGECWPWLGAVRNGYGAIKHNKSVLSAHVVAFVLHSGHSISPEHIICHTCDNRLCCNPAHLYEGTFSDNVRDADRRRLNARAIGVGVHNAVLNDELVLLILSFRVCLDWGAWRIAREIGHNKRTVEKVLTRETWRHVDMPSIDQAKEIVSIWKESTARPR